MQSANQPRKASAGSVQIKVSNQRLQLVFSYLGRRYYLSLGLPDSKANRKAAEMRAAQIERDIAYGEVDPTLAKYKPQSATTGKLSQSKDPLKDSSTPSQSLIGDLWDRYTVYRLPNVTPGTVRTVHNHVRRHIAKFPTQKLEDAELIHLYLTGHLTAYGAKRIMVQLSACCKWAVKARLIESNPFQGMASEIKIKTKKRTEDDEMDIRPFTPQEQSKIIRAFSKSTYYKVYTPLVQLLFATGCRPGEAIALEWRHWLGNEILFEQAVVMDGSYRPVMKDGLKTQEKRRFPCNLNLQALLKSIKPENASPTDLIFPAPRGGQYINWYHFCFGAWKKILSQCGIEYRKPYQTRHTFITQCIEAGIPTKHVAKWVGNSEWIISQHYLGIINQVEVPVMVPTASH
ncbi:MAG: DUF3596 domain-containing protein [Cyanobacteriota bacterium]|nr:DUF3596 domain-containing protein [Cyanobacteriota bacterium]